MVNTCEECGREIEAKDAAVETLHDGELRFFCSDARRALPATDRVESVPPAPEPDRDKG
jgi:hypothetical protein